jgi:hypothetical protein
VNATQKSLFPATIFPESFTMETEGYGLLWRDLFSACAKVMNNSRTSFQKYSIFGIGVDRSQAAKWLFPQEKATSKCD